MRDLNLRNLTLLAKDLSLNWLFFFLFNYQDSPLFVSDVEVRKGANIANIALAFLYSWIFLDVPRLYHYGQRDIYNAEEGPEEVSDNESVSTSSSNPPDEPIDLKIVAP